MPVGANMACAKYGAVDSRVFSQTKLLPVVDHSDPPAVRPFWPMPANVVGQTTSKCMQVNVPETETAIAWPEPCQVFNH